VLQVSKKYAIVNEAYDRWPRFDGLNATIMLLKQNSD